MKKRIFSRIENWLLIVPLILLLVEKLFYGNSTVDLHLHDTYFIIALYHVGIIFFLSTWVPYLCHFLLRTTKKNNAKINLIHVLLTILLVLYLSSSLFTKDLTARKYFDLSSWESSEAFSGFGRYFVAGVLIFVLLQLTFIAYTVVRLIIKKKVR